MTSDTNERTWGDVLAWIIWIACGAIILPWLISGARWVFERWIEYANWVQQFR